MYGYHNSNYCHPAVQYRTFQQPQRYRWDGVTYNPRADVYEDKDTYRIELEMPGTSKENISVKLKEGNVVAIKGEIFKNAAEEGKERELKRRYMKNYELTKAIDAERIEAKYENGLLVVTLHKLVPSETKITIN